MHWPNQSVHDVAKQSVFIDNALVDDLGAPYVHTQHPIASIPVI